MLCYATPCDVIIFYDTVCYAMLRCGTHLGCAHAMLGWATVRDALVLCYDALRYAIELCYALLCSAMFTLRYAMLGYVMRWYAALRCAMLCLRIPPRYDVLCYAMIRNAIKL